MAASRKVKVRVLCPLPGVFAKFQPQVGKIYDAEYSPSDHSPQHRSATICVINVLDKRIALRKEEYEIVGE